MSPTAKVDLKRRIEQVGELPTLPHVVQKLASMIGRPNVSAEEIGLLIEKDQVLSAKVLRLANSPFYGFPSRIASVAHAVVVLGLNVVKGLTLCATAFDMMKTAGMHQLWRHSLGVAITAHILGTKAEMKNPEEAFVAGLLHDIGKAVSHEIEGPHALVGGDLARRHGESEAVVHAMEAHHNEVEPQTVEAVIVQTADALSGARPGARGESLEQYVKRLRDLESIATRHTGVDKVYAMQAGREIRVMVQPGAVDDDAAVVLSHEIAREIEKELEYPGQIKVTVIRESRAVEYAR